MSKTTTSSKGKMPEAPRSMSAADVERAARADHDAPPLTADDLKRMNRTPQAKIIRRALELTQEEFAARYQFRSAHYATGSREALNRTKRHEPI